MEKNQTTGGRDSNIILQIEEIMSMCRICMAQYVKMNSIFEEGHKEISDKIEFCTGVHVTKHDGLPVFICEPCLADLSIACRFKTTCITSDATFHKLMAVHVKREPPPDSDDEPLFNGLRRQQAIKQESQDESPLVKVRKRLVQMKNLDGKSKPVVKLKRALVRKRAVPPSGVVNTGRPKGVKKSLYCAKCDLVFDTKALHAAHKKEMHKEAYMCELCGKVLRHRSSHITHVRSHQPPQFSCEHCDYKTWHKYDLEKHRGIHLGIKRFQCTMCAMSFRTSSNLWGHVRRCHHEDGGRRFPCALCGRSFHDNHKLQRHLDMHNDVKRFQCEVCQCEFTRRSYWKKHLRRKHNIEVPRVKPGRQKTNFVIEQTAPATAHQPTATTHQPTATEEKQ